MVCKRAWRLNDEIMPTPAVKDRVRRNLEILAWSDPEIVCERQYRITIMLQEDGTLADYEEVRQSFGRGGPLNRSCLFSDDSKELTERFVALAWLVLNEEERSELVCREWDGGDDDRSRLSGNGADVRGWYVDLRMPTGRRRVRSAWRLRRLLKQLLQQAQKHLAERVQDIEWARNGLARPVQCNNKLVPWARRRWSRTRPALTSNIEAAVERRMASENSWIELCEQNVVEAKRRVDLLNREIASCGRERLFPKLGGGLAPVVARSPYPTALAVSEREFNPDRQAQTVA